MRQTASAGGESPSVSEASGAQAPASSQLFGTEVFGAEAQADRLRRRAEFLRDLAEAKEMRARMDPRQARVVDLRGQRQALRAMTALHG